MRSHTSQKALRGDYAVSAICGAFKPVEPMVSTFGWQRNGGKQVSQM